MAYQTDNLVGASAFLKFDFDAFAQDKIFVVEDVSRKQKYDSEKRKVIEGEYEGVELLITIYSDKYVYFTNKDNEEVKGLNKKKRFVVRDTEGSLEDYESLVPDEDTLTLTPVKIIPNSDDDAIRYYLNGKNISLTVFGKVEAIKQPAPNDKQDF